MSARRPIHLKAIDAVALLLIGLVAASSTARIFFEVDSWSDGAFAAGLAAAFDCWFVSLALEVRYLWTGRETRLPTLPKRGMRSAR